MSMEQQATSEETSTDISEIAEELLLEFEGEEVRNTSQLRRGTNHPNNTVNYHAKLSKYSLESQGLVQQIGVDESAKSAEPPNQYRLTDKGHDELQRLRQEALDTAVDVTEYDEVKERANEAVEIAARLEKENQNLRERISHLEENAVTEERFDALKNRLEKLLS